MILFGASVFGPYSGGHHTEYKALSARLVSMPEWLRGQTRNLMGFARVVIRKFILISVLFISRIDKFPADFLSQKFFPVYVGFIYRKKKTQNLLGHAEIKMQ